MQDSRITGFGQPYGWDKKIKLFVSTETTVLSIFAVGKKNWFFDKNVFEK